MAKLFGEYFGPITDKDQALKILRDIEKALYGLGIFVAVISIFLKSYLNILDTVFYVISGLLIGRRQSRFMSVLLIIYCSFIVIVTAANFIGYPLMSGGMGGKNIYLAIIVFVVALRAVKATFKYHESIKSKLKIMNVIIFNLIGMILSGIAIFAVSIACVALEENGTHLSDDQTGQLVILSGVVFYSLPFLIALPFVKGRLFTRNDTGTV